MNEFKVSEIPVAGRDPIRNPATESTAEVATKTAELVAEHQGRRKRSDAGKPRQVRNKTEVTAPVVDPALQVNLDLVKKSVESIITAVDGIVCRNIHGKAKRIGIQEPIATELWQQAGLTKNEVTIISESTSLIFVRYEVLMRHAPEVMLGCVLASWGVRIAAVTRKLNQLEERMNEKKKKGDSVEPSTRSE